jgi:hypothetical protein
MRYGGGAGIPMTRQTNGLVQLGLSLGLSLVGALCASACKPGEDPNGGETGTTADAPTTGSSSTTTADSSGSASESPGGSTSMSSTTMEADASSGSTSGGEIELRGACPLDERVGSFLVAMEPRYSSFSGSVADGVVPISVLEQIGADGDCILLRRNNPYCEPLCMPGEACDFDGTCIPYPENHDVGVVSVSGLLQPVMVEPVPPTFAYFDTSLMHPPFDPGAPIELTAAGGDYEAFELHGSGVAMIEPAADEVSLSTEQAVSVEWAATGSEARLRLVLAVDQHGLTPVQLVCESDDTGSLSISAEIITQYLSLGVSGFPSADYYLQTVDSVDITPGCVEFIVRSHRQTALTVEGHTPCDAPSDCPEGQTCDVMIQTCV